MEMERMPKLEFLGYFEELEDPRDEHKVLYPLDEILLVGLATVIVGGEGWHDMELFGKARLRFLRKYLPFENGIPRSITYERVFSDLNPKVFEACLNEWAKSMPAHEKDTALSIDGKTVRGSHNKTKDKNAIHLVSAWGHSSGLVLGQEKVDAKSNEITAIPDVLNAIDIKGRTIIMDAMGCQKSIAKQIHTGKGEYILALKGNHPNTHDEIAQFFARHEALDFNGRGYEFMRHQTIDKGHGRIEVRKITLLNTAAWLSGVDGWAGLRSVAMVERERTINDKTTIERHYYLSSLQTTAEKMLELIRGHWGIENKMHWVLDVVMNEDASRVRRRNADRNLATLRRLALNLIKTNKKKKISIKGSRKVAAWSNIALKRMLMF
jgi:predicted transposase YbfD/YdcC